MKQRGKPHKAKRTRAAARPSSKVAKPSGARELERRLAEAEEFPQGSENARLLGHRTILCVPLMRGGAAIGTIQLRRAEKRLFTDRQVALLQTFADQAVIAIENVRLFTELERRNRDLAE